MYRVSQIYCPISSFESLHSGSGNNYGIPRTWWLPRRPPFVTRVHDWMSSCSSSLHRRATSARPRSVSPAHPLRFMAFTVWEMLTPFWEEIDCKYKIEKEEIGLKRKNETCSHLSELWDLSCYTSSLTPSHPYSPALMDWIGTTICLLGCFITT